MSQGKENDICSKIVVIEILRDISRTHKEIENQTRVYHDLLISGDDAVELINRIHQKFGTSFDGFDFKKFFPEETESLFSRFALFLGRTTKQPLFAGHLVEVVEAGRWFDQVLDQS